MCIAHIGSPDGWCCRAVREPERLWKFAPSVDANGFTSLSCYQQFNSNTALPLKLGASELRCLKLLRPHDLHIGKKQAHTVVGGVLRYDMLGNGVGNSGVANNFDFNHAVGLPRALVRGVVRAAAHVVHGVALRAQALGIGDQAFFYRCFGNDNEQLFRVCVHGVLWVLIFEIKWG